MKCRAMSEKNPTGARGDSDAADLQVIVSLAAKGAIAEAMAKAAQITDSRVAIEALESRPVKERHAGHRGSA